MHVSRRSFLQSAIAASAGFAGLQSLAGCATTKYAQQAALRCEGYGALVPDPEGLVDLPKGFHYTVLARKGAAMDDGFFVPALPDGMAAFAGPGGMILLVCNHELSIKHDDVGPFRGDMSLAKNIPRNRAYDDREGFGACAGGTTTLVYDPVADRCVHHALSLAGTMRNCAGGPTPWNSWITCEETVVSAGEGCEHDHGYCFDVPALEGSTLADPVPLRAMGRFNHEAVAIDIDSGIVYETEDRPDSLIYRFIPNRPGHLREGGRLQALGIRDAKGLDTRNWEHAAVEPGVRLTTRWINLEEIDSPGDSLRYRGYDSGAARFARGEGMWAGSDGIYFACTSGGAAQKGQIWRYAPSPAEGTPDEESMPGTLELFVEPNNPALVENADNLTVAPWGDLIVCEDGPRQDYLVGVTPDGKFYRLGRNAFSHAEFAGATFSPDGATLFVNMQGDGITLAIRGPWETRVG